MVLVFQFFFSLTPEETHIASRLSSTTSAHHGGLDSTAPPVRSGAGLMVDQREIGLLERTSCHQLDKVK